MHDAFISFSFKDLDLAELILNTLTNEYQIKAWMCTHDIQGGRRYKNEIVKAIEDSKVFVLLQSRASVSSEQVPNEVAIALDCGKTVIPFVVDDSRLQGDLYYDLVRVHRIDARKPPIEERIASLARDIRSAIADCQEEKRQDCKEDKAVEPIAALNSRVPVGNRYFAGREDVFQEIAQSFSEGHRIVFLRGMGGIGKSEIAIQYAKRNRDQYETIVFARYEKSLAVTIADDDQFFIEGFVRKITANGDIQTDEEYALDKTKYIAEHCGSETLIIIDNYDVDSDPFFETFIRKGTFRLLVTTRFEQPEQRIYKMIPVENIKDDDTLKQIFIANANPERTFFDKDDPAFEELFAITARHTLALELVAQMAEEFSCVDVGEVVAELKKQGIGVLRGVKDINQNNADAYELIANLVHNMTLSEDEKKLLMYLQLMPAGGIDRVHFKRWCSESVYRTQNRLLKRSTVKYDARTGLISLHPVMREVLNREIPPVFSVCRDFLECFSEDLADYLSWNYTFIEKMMYLECCYSIIRSFSVINKDTFELYYKMNAFLLFTDNLQNNKELFDEMINKARDLYGASSPEYAKICFRKALWMKLSMQSLAAKDLFEQSIVLLDNYPLELFEERHHCYMDLIGLLLDLFSTCQNPERDELLAQAKELYITTEESLQFFPNKDTKLYKCRKAFTYYLHGRLLAVNNSVEDALNEYEAANRIYKSVGHNTDDASVLYRITCLLYDVNRYEESISYSIKAIKRYMQMYELSIVGLLSIRVVNLYLLQARCYVITGASRQSFLSFKEALVAIDKVFEKQSPDYQIYFGDVYHALAECFEKHYGVTVPNELPEFKKVLGLVENLCETESDDPAVWAEVIRESLAV